MIGPDPNRRTIIAEERSNPPAPSPARRLSATEVEAVIRRAVELQAYEGDDPASAHEGMPEAELARIGREIGLSPRHIQQALAETSAAPVATDGLVDRRFGPADVRTSRLVRIPAERAREEMDRYARNQEWMVIHRRFSDRVVYTRATGFAAEVQRGLSGLSRKYPRLDVPELEVSVREAEEDSCYVALRGDLRGIRAGWLGGMAAGGGGSAVLATVLGIAIAPPAALVGVPVLAASAWGSRVGYRRDVAKKRDLMESILDRLEHGELAAPDRPGLRERLGLIVDR
jgi:hypothetical protein